MVGGLVCFFLENGSCAFMMDFLDGLSSFCTRCSICQLASLLGHILFNNDFLVL